MRDFIIAICLFAALVAAFSYGGDYEPQVQREGNFRLPVASGETAEQPTEGTGGTDPCVPDPVPTEAPEPTETEPLPGKSIDDVAWEVIIGLWGYTEERWQMLTDAGYDAQAVQRRVNEIMRME